jgi:hypothetical protein
MTKIPRHLLPQIPSDEYDEFRQFLEDQGVAVKLLFVPVSKLKPIQSEFNRDKVEALKQKPEKLANPIIVNKDGFILDGHHRFVAVKELDGSHKIPCYVANCNLKQLIELGHLFDGSFTRTVHERTIYQQPSTESLIVRKTLKAGWTPEMSEDLSDYHGLDAEAED